MVAAGFQDVQKADDVGVDVRAGVLQGVAHAGLGGQVAHGVELLGGEQGVQALCIFQLQLDEAVGGQGAGGNEGVVGDVGLADAGALQAAVFHTHVVVIVDAVQPHYFVAARKQALGQV